MVKYNERASAGGDGSSFGREMGLNNSRGDEVSSDRYILCAYFPFCLKLIWLCTIWLSGSR